MSDGRRRQWYASSVSGAFSVTEQRLREEWGCEGGYFWRLLLDAAAREVEPGTFTYRNDIEAWTKLGVISTAFTPEEFFRFTGRLRQTRKTQRNRTTIIALTRWGDWQLRGEREREREQKSRKRREKAPDKRRTSDGHTTAIHASTVTDTVTDTSTDRTGVVEGSSQEPVDLKIVEQDDFHVERLLEVITDGDERTPSQIRRLARRVAPNVTERIREQIREGGVRSACKYAHAELKREVAARSAA